ncbi:MAG TPA: hypothetical protein VKA82_14125 [Rubrobacter sp.]|nr:hypothetical protein [Rubrobacter sp.]
MERILEIVVGILRLMPLILAFYIPALFGMVTWSERGQGYRIKALLWFVIGFGTIVAVHILLRSVSAGQVAEVLGLSLIEIAIALYLAALTVNRLAD